MARRVAITGASGQLGRQLVRAFNEVADDVLALSRPDFVVTEASHLARLTAWRPDVVVNSVAWTDVDGCARDPPRAMVINGEVAGAVARAAAEADALIVHLSTNEVFDGTLDRPYTENDEPNPINPYGLSKLAGEGLVAAATDRHLIVRTAWLYGGPVSFPEKIRAAASSMIERDQPLRVVEDEWGNPTDVRWLAPAVERLLSMVVAEQAPAGAYHLAGWPPTSRFGWAAELLTDLPVRLEAISAADYARASRVPLRAILDVSRAAALGIGSAAWRSGARR